MVVNATSIVNVIADGIIRDFNKITTATNLYYGARGWGVLVEYVTLTNQISTFKQTMTTGFLTYSGKTPEASNTFLIKWKTVLGSF